MNETFPPGEEYMPMKAGAELQKQRAKENLATATDYQYYIVTHEGFEIGISEDEWAAILTNQSQKLFEIGDVVIAMSSISQILPAHKLDHYRHVKKGDWLCRYGTWHSKKEADWECTCGRSH